ncbi:SDR family NAD(P)-dependent oxidoreductase [Paraburkholderia bannensis]|uniref:Short-chain dehydrogenase n=1 Tax=Paraburkholderia tropica TaxID=92647 RepID=A0AAQ1JT31_9BURK|nr:MULTISPECIES: SDR family NAD(P)-dependent oxidoreductase [Paraburkholderia]RQM50967.1 SDR family NAD(P)-dependent oxidoreductase [Paraburkholderia bannensis]RQN40303.1 SDR family NAD(P)-dependent oxidoreductase [Paraburkholderia tropica]SEJ33233.1 Short-chain dehydrogenase [Paraburkholderia tropica]
MKTYLVIGAGPGIGLATAQKFAAEGYRVVLAARAESKLKDAITSLHEAGANISFATVDAADPHAVEQLIRQFGDDLAVVHYNAGVLHYDASGALRTAPLESESVESLQSEATINLVSALAAVKAARELFAHRGGTILLTGGGFGIEPTASFINISVAKAGLRAAAKALFEPLRAINVHLATVTVATLVSPESEKSREIGATFWELHNQPEQAAWDWERIVN